MATWVTIGRFLRQKLIDNITSFTHNFTNGAKIFTFFRRIQFTPQIRRITVTHSDNGRTSTVSNLVEKSVMTSYRTIPESQDSLEINKIMGIEGDGSSGYFLLSGFRYYEEFKKRFFPKISRHYQGRLIKNTYSESSGSGDLTWRFDIPFISLKTFYIGFPNGTNPKTPQGVQEFNAKHYKWTKDFNRYKYCNNMRNVAQETTWERTFMIDIFVNDKFISKAQKTLRENGEAFNKGLMLWWGCTFWIELSGGLDGDVKLGLPKVPNHPITLSNGGITVIDSKNSNMYFTKRQEHLDITFKVRAQETLWHEHGIDNASVKSKGIKVFDNVSSIVLDINKIKVMDLYLEEYDKGDLSVSQTTRSISAILQEK